MDLVQRALQAEAVKPAERPGGGAPDLPSARRDVVGDVVAVAIVGLDPLDAERQHLLDLRAPPLLGAALVKSTGEPGPHPPLGHERAAVVLHEVAGRGAFAVPGRRLAVQTL